MKELHNSIEYHFATDIGKRRRENQDRYGSVIKERYKLLMVADGMGGAKGGALAAQTAVERISEHLENVEDITPDAIREAILFANTRIFKKSLNDPSLSGMGTTVVLYVFTADKLYIANVGDSRAYLIRDQKSQQLTQDHTLMNELTRTGLLDDSQARSHPVAHMLTRCLGPSANVIVDCFLDSSGPSEGDVYLLCSDGLYNMVSDEDVTRFLDVDNLEKDGLERVAQKLLSLANHKGGKDNITVCILRIKGYQDPEEHSVQEGFSAHDLVPIIFEGDQGEDSYEKVLYGYTDYKNNKFLSKGHLFQKELTTKAVFLSISCLLLGIIITYVTLFPAPSVHNQNPYTARSKSYVKHPDVKNALAQARALKKLNDELLAKDYVALYEKYLLGLEQGHQPAQLVSLKESLLEQLQSLERDILTNKANIDVFNRKLSVWFGHKSRLETEGALNLSSELVNISNEIKSKHDAFQEASWAYVQTLESAQGDDANQESKQRVADLLAARKSAMKNLELSVYSEIQSEIDSINKEISEMIMLNIKIETQQALLGKELEIVKLILETDNQEELISSLTQQKQQYEVIPEKQ